MTAFSASGVPISPNANIAEPVNPDPAMLVSEQVLHLLLSLLMPMPHYYEHLDSDLSMLASGQEPHLLPLLLLFPNVHAAIT